jgi:tetratricopeptide (TPR) repeat protein
MEVQQSCTYDILKASKGFSLRCILQPIPAIAQPNSRSNEVRGLIHSIADFTERSISASKKITMSEEEAAAANMMCCASCGQAEIDDIKLKLCDGGCDLVKYCRDECQENHRDQHEEECKKRTGELRDRDLFTQPERSCHGDCPICFLPLPLDLQKTKMMSCCSKVICMGCDYANAKREYEAGLEHKCAFCREPMAKTDKEVQKRLMKRVKKNDQVAIREVGRKCYEKGDYETAFKYYAKAAELGDADAHYQLSFMHQNGDGVEKDKKKELYHLEEAAIGSNAAARHNLGVEELKNGRFDRARKHFIIAANHGLENPLKAVRKLYANGHASKEDYADALRAYQAAVDATKSEERKKAEKAIKNGEVILN